MSDPGKETTSTKQAGIETNRNVRDPVTGGQVTIHDATENPEEIPLGENVLKMEFPPPDLQGQREYLLSLFNTTVSRMTLAFAIVPILAFSISPPALTSRPLFLLIPSLGIPAALSFLWMYRMQTVWAEVTGIVGTARMRLELIPDPPFIKHMLITLVGLPKVSIGITPIHKKLLPNMMDIPFISRFVTQSINAAAKEYVAPKSMMLDIQQLLSGDGVSRDTTHIGVVVVQIHQVSVSKNVKQTARDMNAYMNICLSPMNKTQYSTRIISGTLDPVFEETAVLLVDANAAKIGERVTLQLWDNDRFTADDLVGEVEIDVAELMSKHNQATRKTVSMLQPTSNKESGTIEYTIGFFSKLAPGSTSSATEIPQDILEKDVFKKARKSTLTDLEAAVAVTPPPDDFVSGILGIQLHEIRELGVMKDNMAIQHSGKGSSTKPEGEQEIESDKGLPSSYCTVMVNDEPVYRTRTKPMTATPFFNASTERFVRDWKATHVCVVVRDSRMRENDPVMGMVMFKLSDLFRDGSMATGSWSLQHGIGFGRIHLSFVFRPVQLTMPPSLIGFDTGTVQVKSININLYDKSLQGDVEVRLSTTGGYTKIKKGINEKEESSEDEGSNPDSLVHLPIQTRYHSALVINARNKGLFKRGTIAMGIVWLRDLVDNHHDGVIRAKLWKTDDFDHIKQNYAKPEESAVGNNAEAIGEVEMKVVFKPGIADAHEKDMKEDPKKQKSWEEYTIMKRKGLRRNIGRDGAAVDEADISPNVLANKVEEPSQMKHEATNSSGSLNENVKQWTSQQDSLSAEHRGIKQFKGVRTAEWMADGLKNAMMGLGHRKDRKETMEKEA
ncbi:hypothetical protein FRC15_001048 [Serendipita sp. 397]|nr:hypothetical protein FRC15_001048 [Serendipita sp. 397]